MERIAFDACTGAGRINESDALRHHPHHIGGPRGSNQIARALDAQPRISFQPGLVAGCAGRARQIGKLVHDDLRGGSLYRARERLCVKDIDHRRRGAECGDGVVLSAERVAPMTV